MRSHYVWYASYGSNLSPERFLCYIKGGKPEGSERAEVGCRDSTAPLDESVEILHFPLYFAKSAERWQNQGVAFIGLDYDRDVTTYSRKYLITPEQFLDVVQQENNGARFDINLDEVIAKRSVTFNPHSWYGTIVYTGEFENKPVFTFTSSWNMNVPLQTPSEPYLTMIIRGLKSIICDHEIADYLFTRPEVAQHYTAAHLHALISKA